jgi:hypothetical protein
MKDKFYYKDGTTSSEPKTSKQLHRENGPAVECTNGTKSWYVDGKQHREDGPACEYANGDKIWYIDNERHRTDGPAVECVDRYKSWYVDGKYYDEVDFNKLMEEVRELPLALRLIDPREWVRKYEK